MAGKVQAWKGQDTDGVEAVERAAFLAAHPDIKTGIKKPGIKPGKKIQDKKHLFVR
ncbi:hypothetical protein [Photobacterium atrarenae]|uniref:Uncharacterized protein n=1 Tax=Photobacterium atrarenae TaxID=865757 RepID=A0ABY5GCP1_9GAMM|nr:hypothetical protein [Photobacterium atrarenae]UTV26956.1 hypothetical protein NNL38_11435 [Photobacterium atrarenae]